MALPLLLTGFPIRMVESVNGVGYYLLRLSERILLQEANGCLFFFSSPTETGRAAYELFFPNLFFVFL